MAAKSTVTYLKDIMPGQPEAWYERIAGEITAGRMPLPRIDTPPPATKSAQAEKYEAKQAQKAKQAEKAQSKPKAKPKSKTKQLKQGRYFKAQPKPQPQPEPTPKTLSEPQFKSEPLLVFSPPPKVSKQPASASIKWKLENLLHGDRRMAARLVAQVAFDHPHRSEQWCWEKALHDLQRDRR